MWQLKKILARQAELGVEVAEIPSSYLKDSTTKGLEGEEKRNSTNKRKLKKKFERTDQFESRRDRKDIDDHGSQEARKRRETEHGSRPAGLQESKSRSVGLVEAERRRESESRGHRTYHGRREDQKREDNSVLQKVGDKRALEDHVNEDRYGSRRYSKDERSYDDAKRRRYEDSWQHRRQDRYNHHSTEDAGRHRH